MRLFFLQIMLLLFFGNISAAVYSQETYRLLNEEPEFHAINYRSTKDRLLFHIHNRLCADTTEKKFTRELQVAYIGAKYYLKLPANLFDPFYKEYQSLEHRQVFHPFKSVFNHFNPDAGKKLIALNDDNYALLDAYRFFSTYARPVKLIPNFADSSAAVKVFNASGCTIKVFSENRAFVQNLGEELLVESGDILSIGVDIKNKQHYRRVGAISDDNLIIFDFGSRVIGNNDFIQAMAFGLLGHRPKFRKDRFVPAYDFIPDYLIKRTPVKLSLEQNELKAVQIWNDKELFKTFSYLKIFVPDYPGLIVLSDFIVQRLRTMFKMNPEIQYVSMNDFVNATPDQYDLRLNIINFDTPELVDIWKKTAVDNGDFFNNRVAQGDLNAFVPLRLTEANILKLYKRHLPLYRVVYPLYKKITN